jgi:hypothetical protein
MNLAGGVGVHGIGATDKLAVPKHHVPDLLERIVVTCQGMSERIVVTCQGMSAAAMVAELETK